MDSSFNIECSNELINSNTSQPTSDITMSNINTITSNIFKDSIYNNPNYILDDSNIYIFKNGLFTRSLLNIDYNKEREMLIKCTICSYNKKTTIKGFQSSNFVHYY